LKAFAKVPLKPGQTRHVQLELDAHSLACWNTNIHGWDILPGIYQVMVGSSSSDIRLQGTFNIRPNTVATGGSHWQASMTLPEN
jgi:beta-glucosidase